MHVERQDQLRKKAPPQFVVGQVDVSESSAIPEHIRH